MFVPFFTKRSADKKLFRRKGGGGKGGGSSGGGKSSEGGGGGSSSGGSSGTARSSSISSAGTSKAATSYGGGGGRAITIPSGQLFAGRSAGGGTRSEVTGTQYVIQRRSLKLDKRILALINIHWFAGNTEVVILA
jgi:hypothetical protein